MIDYGFGVKLNRLTESDLTFIFNCRNEPEVFKWCRQNAPLHWKNHVEWFEWQRKDPSTEMFGVWSCRDHIPHHYYGPVWTDVPEGRQQSDDFLVGVCGLTGIDKVNGRAEFSLYVAPNHWNRGFGQGALKTLFGWGFRALRLNRIWGETFDGNGAASLFSKLGMEHEGTRLEAYYRDGDFINAHLYSISAAAFNDLHLKERPTGTRKRTIPDLKPIA